MHVRVFIPVEFEINRDTYVSELIIRISVESDTVLFTRIYLDLFRFVD